MTTNNIPAKPVSHSIKETLESLIVAFILAFVFRAFVVEAFVIPTGSMADTLRGAHFQLVCQNCGYQYNYGFDTGRYGMNKGKLPSNPLLIQTTDSKLRRLNTQNPICPMCGQPAANETPRYVANGDRILVLKYLYQFAEPARWDVVVFKNPWNPYENYIKRLVAKPGETLELIDGDVYIDGVIQTKPPIVQDTLWIQIFDNAFQPVDEKAAPAWRQPFGPVQAATGWKQDNQRHVITFDGAANTQRLEFAPQRLSKLTRSFCAYNGDMIDPYSQCSDLKFYTLMYPAQNQGQFTIELGKYGRAYTDVIDFAGQCRILSPDGQTLAQAAFTPPQPGGPLQLSFATLDHTLQLQINNEKPLVHTGLNLPADWGYGPDAPAPTLAIAAQGPALRLELVRLFRDIYYIDNMGGRGRAGHGKPFVLKDDQFFVCGDNSPQSYDSRLWEQKGVTNDPQVLYNAGIVPRDYMIGKAFFVYWPAGFRPTGNTRIALIPNFGQMRFIY